MGLWGHNACTNEQSYRDTRYKGPSLWELYAQIEDQSYEHTMHVQSSICSVAAVHVTRVLPVGWMVQPNHGQRSIFKSSHSLKQYTYIGIHRWTD